MKIYFPFLPCLFPPIVLSLLSFSQVGVTSLVEVTAGAQTRISVRSVSAQFYLSRFPLHPNMIPFPVSTKLKLTLTAISAPPFLLVCHSDKDGVRAAV